VAHPNWVMLYNMANVTQVEPASSSITWCTTKRIGLIKIDLVIALPS